MTALALNHKDEVFCVTGQVRFYGELFIGGREGICSDSVRNVAASLAFVAATTERTRRKLCSVFILQA